MYSFGWNGYFAESTAYVNVNQDGIFANNELNLRHIEVYGFDYDYTLASYYEEIHHLIYDFAVDSLINKYGVRFKKIML